MMRLLIITIISCFFLSQGNAQEVEQINESVYISEDLNSLVKFDTKNPLKASLYSAVLPGLGQVYNEQYWKVPVVWGLLGTGIGFTVYYNKRHKHYRDAFIAELNGETHKYSGILDASRLGVIQDDMKRNRDYAIVLTVLAYALNILDATVDAHLYEIRKDKDLSIDPTAFIDPQTGKSIVGLALTLKLN